MLYVGLKTQSNCIKFYKQKRYLVVKKIISSLDIKVYNCFQNTSFVKSTKDFPKETKLLLHKCKKKKIN